MFSTPRAIGSSWANHSVLRRMLGSAPASKTCTDMTVCSVRLSRLTISLMAASTLAAGVGASSLGGWYSPSTRNVSHERIAFAADPGLGVMKVNGTAVRWLVRPRGGYPYCSPRGGLRWSPGGKEIAVFLERRWGDPDDPSDFAEGGLTSDLYVIEVASRHRTLILVSAEDTSDGVDPLPPSWSPDGSRLALTLEPPTPGLPQIRLVSSKGGQTTLLRKSAWQPAWSPDGRKIAYTRDFLVPEEIHSVSPNGTGDRRLTAGASPAWSPDGSTITYVRAGDVWVMNADGENQRRVTRTPIDESEPVWSPDGQTIAYVRAGSVFTIRPDGGGARELTRGAGSDSGISWSPDGRTIVFNRFTNRAAESWSSGTIITVDARRGHSSERKLGTGSDPAWSPASN
jgi:dipeptidyl aminopeptidase/acylaminoacyl peptidase